jgi:hypothetical protein
MGPSEETLKNIAGVMAGAMDPQFEQRAAEIKSANTRICKVCGQVHFHKEREACEGCEALLEEGQTALVDSKLRFVFVEFPEQSEEADLRGTVQAVDSRVIDTYLSHAASESN